MVAVPGNEGSVPDPPLVVLLDASYSMSLPMPDGRSRRRHALDALARRLDALPDSVGVYLLVAEDLERVRIALPPGASRERLLDEAARIAPFGAVDLLGSVAASIDLIRSFHPVGPVDLLVVSDGQDLSAHFASPSARDTHEQSASVPDRVTLSVLDWEGGPGAGVLRAFAESDEPAVAQRFPPDEPADAPVAGAEPTPAGGRGTEAVRVRIWLVLARIAALSILVALLVVIGRRELIHRRACKEVRRHNAQPPRLALRIRGPGGSSTVECDAWPVTVGTRPSVSVPLPLLPGEAAAGFSLELDGDRLRLTADEPLAVNGVKRTEWMVGPGDLLRFGRYRVLIDALSRPKLRREPWPFHRRWLPYPAAAALVVLALLLPSATGGRRSPARPDHTANRRSSDVAATPAPRASLPTVSPVGATISSVGATAVWVSELLLQGAGDPPALPEVFKFGEEMPRLDADFLAIHAHPDDESLDFGVLLASLSEAGLRGAVALFTDGSSGLDQHPRRRSDGPYPEHRLTGPGLAAVRVNEARRAIGWLGVERYVRFGYQNHPYNAVLDLLSPATVITRWGGTEPVVTALVELIRATNPRIVISPDGPSGPFEHFEHEAVGLLVREAVERTRYPAGPVRAHLVSVDPLQTAGYDAFLGIPAAPVRERQLAALLEHHTQRDASVIGVETRMGLPSEWYAVSYWDPAFAPPAAFGLAERAREGRDTAPADRAGGL